MVKNSHKWLYAILQTIAIMGVGGMLLAILSWAYSKHPIIPVVCLFGAILIWRKKVVDWSFYQQGYVTNYLNACEALKELVVLKRMRMAHGGEFPTYKARKEAAWKRAFDTVDSIDIHDSRNHDFARS